MTKDNENSPTWYRCKSIHRSINDKYAILGEAIIRDYLTHYKKEITVTITDADVLEDMIISVDKHPIASFSEDEMTQIYEEL